MLNCRACLWRCIEPLDIPSANAYRLQRSVNTHVKLGQRRPLYTRDVVPPVQAKHYDNPQIVTLSRRRQEPWQKSAVGADQKRRATSALLQNPAPGTVDETPNLENLGKRDPRISEHDWNRRKRELRYLQDRLELAEFVKKELKKDKVTEMLQLVRMASHSMECIVGWNHILDHLLRKERVNEAFKVYNDMKKRAQFPDSYTYSIVLRGLSFNTHHSGVVGKALSVYYSLSAPNSRVKPSIIHTNSALRVCARALDMDALWGIAGTIPESGPGAANVVTYITIINAIRQNILLNAPIGETEEEAAARRERAVVEGRRMWEDIIKRWRNGDMLIDEGLVCAMGRLLLEGTRPRDWDDVLSLVEQTMDIPRLVPRLGSIERQNAGLTRLRSPNVPEQYRFDDDHLSPDQHSMRGDEFLALSPQGIGDAVSKPLAYARPGPNILSVIQEACQRIVALKASQEYWDLLTDPGTYNIQPDFDNISMRLRILRQNRASAAVVKVLKEDMIKRGMRLKPGTFRIAMSTCVRDKNNHNSLKHAGQILNMMSKTLEDADPKTVTAYAELAISFPLAKGSDLVDALTVLYPVVENIRLQLGVGGERRGGGGVGATYLTGEQREHAILALRKVYGLYDKLCFSNLIEEAQKAPIKAERARLAAFIGRNTYKSGDANGAAHGASENQLGGPDVDLHGYLKDEGTDDVQLGNQVQEQRDERRDWKAKNDERPNRREKSDDRPDWKKQWSRPIEKKRSWSEKMVAR